MEVGAMTEEEFIARLTNLRLQRGVSARDMSLSMGQSESYINRIESGKMLPSMTGFFYICDYFSITPGEFFGQGEGLSLELLEGLRGLAALSPDRRRHVIDVIHDLEA